MATCKVEGCNRDAMYREECVCQKHYFRRMRTGSYELLPKPKAIQRKTNAKGYVLLHAPDHPLAMSDGYVYEHRAVVFARFGHSLPACEICGAATNWATCHVDHRDEVVTNNTPENLRPICRGCNTSRTQRATIPRFEFRGRLMTLTELAKVGGVAVCRTHLKRRIASGMLVEEAMFTPNKTHPQRSAE